MRVRLWHFLRQVNYHTLGQARGCRCLQQLLLLTREYLPFLRCGVGAYVHMAHVHGGMARICVLRVLVKVFLKFVHLTLCSVSKKDIKPRPAHQSTVFTRSAALIWRHSDLSWTILVIVAVTLQMSSLAPVTLPWMARGA